MDFNVELENLKTFFFFLVNKTTNQTHNYFPGTSTLSDRPGLMLLFNVK